MHAFVYHQFAVKVRFGADAVQHLELEAASLGLQRVLVLCTPEQRGHAEMAARLLGARFAGVFDQAAMHVPAAQVAAAADTARQGGADGLLAIGGGSTLGLAKAVTLATGLPIIAVPTTYAGSEMTTIHGITDQGAKKTGRDPRVLPRTVLYDPVLTQTLPVPMSVTSGFNAMAHAAEALYAPDTNPVVGLMAEEAIRAMADGLKKLVAGEALAEGRSNCLYAAWLAGAALGTTQMGLHHRICHVLGGKLNLPHAPMHAVVLPYVLRYNAPSIGPALGRIAQALGAPSPQDVPHVLRQLGMELGVPASLAELGMTSQRLDEITAELMHSDGYVNPAALEAGKLRQLLVQALQGSW
ncbi:MAG: maleylacetate reductase [Ramlibacter sp.]|nr:maleylacetate reductase [Ramlibacter sp.]